LVIYSKMEYLTFECFTVGIIIIINAIIKIVNQQHNPTIQITLQKFMA
jgi:hypothetical protein